MIRGQVLLSLYLLMGLIFIVDLYIACVYLNNYFEDVREKSVRERRFSRLSDGFGRDYGFDVRKAPPRAFFFDYTFNTSNGYIVISSPMRRLVKHGLSLQDITNYVGSKVVVHYDYGVPSWPEDDDDTRRMMGKLHKGTIWVRKGIILQLQKRPFVPVGFQLVAVDSKKRRRHILPPGPGGEGGISSK